jgi:hypothetical protein
MGTYQSLQVQCTFNGAARAKEAKRPFADKAGCERAIIRGNVVAFVLLFKLCIYQLPRLANILMIRVIVGAHCIGDRILIALPFFPYSMFFVLTPSIF